MFYKTCEEFLNANMKDAYKIANKLKGQDKEKLIDTLDFLKLKVLELNQVMNWNESAVKETVTDEQYQMIMKLFMSYMHNDFITNCEWGKEMADKGLLKPSGFKLFGKLDDN